MNQSLVVRLKNPRDRSYRVTVRQGLLKEVPRILAREWRGREVFVITDANVRRHYGSRFLSALAAAGISASLLDIPAGEQSKNAGVVFALHSQLLAQGISRDSLIVALGGGVVGDITGFVAATVLRGVRYVQIPTTLLAQVDSSVGGKVGIDHAAGKNLIGAFYQPSAVFIDPSVLRTLPAREFRNGLAEIVKIAAGMDHMLFRLIERDRKKIVALDMRVLTRVILRSIALKASVVEKDEFDDGVRKVLNLGHTIGHAIEAASGYAIKHGEAVAAGLAAESAIARAMGVFPERDLTRLLNLLGSLGLPTTVPPIRDRKRFFSALALDKKSEMGMAKFVLLKGIGRAVIGVSVPTPFITEVAGTLA